MTPFAHTLDTLTALLNGRTAYLCDLCGQSYLSLCEMGMHRVVAHGGGQLSGRVATARGPRPESRQLPHDPTQRAEATTTPEGAKGWVDQAGSAHDLAGGHGLDVAPDASPEGVRAEARHESRTAGVSRALPPTPGRVRMREPVDEDAREIRGGLLRRTF